MLNFDYILNRMADPILRASLIDREIDQYRDFLIETRCLKEF